MKIISNTLEIKIGRWDDPGDYPNALAAGPLPSYDYVEEVFGALVIQLEDGDDPVAEGSYPINGSSAPGYCALCRKLEIEQYGRVLNQVGLNHKKAVTDAGCKHPAEYMELLLEEINSDVFEALCEAEPSYVNVLKWDVSRDGDTIT